MHENRYSQGVHEYNVTMVVTRPDGALITDDEHSVVWAKTERQARVNAIDETWNAYAGNVLISVTSVTRL